MCIFSFLQARYETALIFSPKESLYCLGAARGGEAVVQSSLTNTVSLLIENKMVMIFLTKFFASDPMIKEAHYLKPSTSSN